MVDGGFQESSEARAKYDRARLSSTQLSTYFTGSMEMWDIELEARRRAAARPGARAAARPAGRVRRDAGLPLPRPPRVGHRARHAADLAAPTGVVRLAIAALRRRLALASRGGRCVGVAGRAACPATGA